MEKSHDGVLAAVDGWGALLEPALPPGRQLDAHGHAGVHGTVYEATVDPDSSSEVKVYTGEVAVKNNPLLKTATAGGEPGEVSGPSEVPGPSEVSLEEWVSIVHDMQKIRIDKKGKPKAVEPFKKNEADSWVKWNMERDKRIADMFGENEE